MTLIGERLWLSGLGGALNNRTSSVFSGSPNLTARRDGTAARRSTVTPAVQARAHSPSPYRAAATSRPSSITAMA